MPSISEKGSVQPQPQRPLAQRQNQGVLGQGVLGLRRQDADPRVARNALIARARNGLRPLIADVVAVRRGLYFDGLLIREQNRQQQRPQVRVEIPLEEREAIIEQARNHQSNKEGAPER